MMATSHLMVIIFFMILFPLMTEIHCYPGEEKHDTGTLEGDVLNWAALIENYILQVRWNCYSEGILALTTITSAGIEIGKFKLVAQTRFLIKKCLYV
jgi:hypothetical protein